jgi:hypothetical protein
MPVSRENVNGAKRRHDDSDAEVCVFPLLVYHILTSAKYVESCGETLNAASAAKGKGKAAKNNEEVRSSISRPLMTN